MTRQKFWALCLECEHGWTPDKSKGQLRCNKCGSRDVLKKTPDEILDRVRKKAQEKAERNRGGVMPSTAVKCRWCGAYFAGTETLNHHIEKEHPKQWANIRDKLKGERAEGLSLGPAARTDRRRAQGRAPRDDDRTAARRPSGRGKSEGAEQLIYKRIGVEPTKLERIIAGWSEWPERTEIGENGKPRVSEEQNVEWIHLVGKVEWRTAHKIFHEVLMKDAECTLPVDYKPME